MSILSDKILELRNEGKTYTEIQKLLNCSKSVISYYINPNGKKQNIKRQNKRRSKIHPLQYKLERFLYEKPTVKKLKPTSSLNNLLYIKLRNFFYPNRNMQQKHNITIDDLIQKVGENPICYLTGTQINIYEPRTYQFDHIIPVSRGGQNTLDNLGICTKQANQAKNNMTPDELLNFCKLVLEHHNYTVSKN